MAMKSSPPGHHPHIATPRLWPCRSCTNASIAMPMAQVAISTLEGSTPCILEESANSNDQLAAACAQQQHLTAKRRSRGGASGTMFAVRVVGGGRHAVTPASQARAEAAAELHRSSNTIFNMGTTQTRRKTIKKAARSTSP